MIDPITPLFLKALPSLAKHGGQLALKKVFPPVSKAIKATANDFPRYTELHHWLDAWCASSDFFELQGLYREGERISAGAVTESFAQFIGLVNPDHSERCAEEVLPVFLRHIDEEEFGSVGLAIIDQRNQARTEEVSAQLEQITSIVASSHQLLAGMLVPENDSFVRSADETALDAQLDTAKRLIDAWRPRAASLILEDLRPKLGGNRISVGLRFRLEALTGCVCLATDDAKRAEGHFCLAVELDPGNARARANLSTARARKGMSSEALEDAKRALGLSPQDAYVASIYLRRLVESERYLEFDEFLAAQTEKLADPHFLAAVGDGYWSQGRRQDIVAIIRPRLNPEIQFAPAWEVVGRALLLEAQTILQTQRILPWQMPAHLRQMVQDAESALSETITIIAHTEGDLGLAGVYVNRACSRTLQGRLADAEDDIDRALSLKRDLDEGNHAKAMLLIERREYRSALEYLHRINPTDMTMEMRGAVGCAYLRADQPRDAVRELAALFNSAAATLHQKVVAAELLVQAHHQLNDPHSAEDVVVALRELGPDDPEVLCVESQHKERIGDTEGAKLAVERAAQIVDAQKRGFVSIDLASFYFRQGQYLDAARVYETMSGLNMNRVLREKYVESLVKSGQIGKTYEFIRRIRLEECFDAGLAHVEFQICEQIGDLDGANSLLEELQRRVPGQRAHYSIRLATNYYRRANREACRKALDSVVKSELAGSADELMQAAKLRRWLGMDCVLDFGHAAWVAGRNRPEIALGYLSLTLVPQDSDHVALAPSPVDIGSRVIMRRGSESRTVDLVGDDDQPEAPPARVRITSSLGKKLANLSKGAEVRIGADIYVIEEVQSKYVAAHQDILRDFQLAFPDHPGLQRMEFKDGDLTPFFAVIERRHEYANGALRVYREKRAALGTLANVLGESLLDVWLSLVRSESGDKVLASEGSEAELQLELDTVAQATDVVVDATALLTAARLSILHLLRQRFGTVYVAQDVLDEFLDSAAIVDYGPKAGGRIGKVGNRYVMTDKPDEEYQHDRAALLAELIRYLSTEVVLLPCRGRLDYSSKEWSGFNSTLGRGAIASIVVAKDMSLPLYSDDFAVRAVARNDWNVKSFWTQSFLVDGLRRSLIAQSDYFDLVSSLVQNHYHFVRIDARYLLRMFEKSGLTLSKEVLDGLGTLGDADCSIESAVRVAADVVATCFTNALPTHFQDLVLDATLGALTQNRSAHIVLPALSVTVAQRLGTGSRAGLKVQDSIRLWQRILFR